MLRDLFPRHHERYKGSRCGVELEAFAEWLEAQAQVFPEVLAPPKGGAFVFRGEDITGWLRRL